MLERFVVIIKIGTYLALMPFVYRIILSFDISRFFKRNHTTEIRLVYLLIAIVITKIVGDFINDIMDLLRILFDLI